MNSPRTRSKQSDHIDRPVYAPHSRPPTPTSAERSEVRDRIHGVGIGLLLARTICARVHGGCLGSGWKNYHPESPEACDLPRTSRASELGGAWFSIRRRALPKATP
jgi:hypothetical protein